MSDQETFLWSKRSKPKWPGLLPGVNIILENTTPPVGAATDADGVFSMNTIPGSYNMTATFVGYKNQTKFNLFLTFLTSGNIHTINFELEEGQTTLSEIVVEPQYR